MSSPSVLISRVDHIGDLILTLPLCGLIKKSQPDWTIYFLCRPSVRSVAEQSRYIDRIIIWEHNVTQLPQTDILIHVSPDIHIARTAKHKKIKIRIGTNRRWFHWIYCNKLVNLTRKNSDLHEAELNIKLLKPLAIFSHLKKNQLWRYYGWETKAAPSYTVGKSVKSFRLIFHIKSRGSSREWPSQNYLTLACFIKNKNCEIYLTGTHEEGIKIKQETPELILLPNVSDMTGKFSLAELIQFIKNSDGLIAASTGPLHIAAASGIFCLGLFPNEKPIHSGRWGPLGIYANDLSEERSCNKAYLNIDPKDVLRQIEPWFG